MVVLQTMIKSAAISGIALFWLNFTYESLKLAFHIISDSPKTIKKQKKSCVKAAMAIFWMMGVN